ncbi:MAG: hypothetical protein KJ645_14465, partial [Planctomycetes bacterium]|nr:hypothetical protein [Planctomycetota bacterium]
PFQLLAFSLFALLALMRILLTSGTFHYGFCLALPGVMLFAVAVLRLFPSWFPSWFKHPRLFAPVFMVLLLTLSANNFLGASRPMYQARTIPIESPRGSLYVLPSPYGINLHPVFELLKTLGRPGDTLVVLPEGSLINFLTDQPNPLYYNLFIPPELNTPGVERAVIEQIEACKVDRILIIGRSVDEYGFHGLGIDYGTDLMAYIGAHYKEESSSGPTPYRGQPGGCILYRRKK